MGLARVVCWDGIGKEDMGFVLGILLDDIKELLALNTREIFNFISKIDQIFTLLSNL